MKGGAVEGQPTKERAYLAVNPLTGFLIDSVIVARQASSACIDISGKNIASTTISTVTSCSRAGPTDVMQPSWTD